jgi:hypothetical protein
MPIADGGDQRPIVPRFTPQLIESQKAMVTPSESEKPPEWPIWPLCVTGFGIVGLIWAFSFDSRIAEQAAFRGGIGAPSIYAIAFGMVHLTVSGFGTSERWSLRIAIVAGCLVMVLAQKLEWLS